MHRFAFALKISDDLHPECVYGHMGVSATSLWHHLFWAASMLFCCCSASAVSVRYSGAPAGPGQARTTGSPATHSSPLHLMRALRHANVFSVVPLPLPSWRDEGGVAGGRSRA